VEDVPRIVGLVGLPQWHAAHNALLLRAEAGPVTAIEKPKFIFYTVIMKKRRQRTGGAFFCRGY
jgi:hypothetical protein